MLQCFVQLSIPVAFPVLHAGGGEALGETMTASSRSSRLYLLREVDHDAADFNQTVLPLLLLPQQVNRHQLHHLQWVMQNTYDLGG